MKRECDSKIGRSFVMKTLPCVSVASTDRIGNPHPMDFIDSVPMTFNLAGVDHPNAIAKNAYSIVPIL
jgi:hypothetical protein